MSTYATVFKEHKQYLKSDLWTRLAKIWSMERLLDQARMHPVSCALSARRVGDLDSEASKGKQLKGFSHLID